MYISCTDSSCQNYFPDFLLVNQNSFTIGYPMNCLNKPVLAPWICTWDTHDIHLESTSPFKLFRAITNFAHCMQIKLILNQGLWEQWQLRQPRSTSTGVLRQPRSTSTGVLRQPSRSTTSSLCTPTLVWRISPHAQHNTTLDKSQG